MEPASCSFGSSCAEWGCGQPNLESRPHAGDRLLGRDPADLPPHRAWIASGALVGLAASPAGAPRNILFIQLAEMGTMVVAYPALEKARELFPDATLHFLCFAQIRPSVEMLDIIPRENILTIDAGSAIGVRARHAALSAARPPPSHRHGDQPGVVRQVQQHAELPVGRPAARRLPPLQPGGAVRGRPVDPQGALQRAHPCRAHLPRSRARPRTRRPTRCRG